MCSAPLPAPTPPRLTLDKEDILAWGKHTKDDVLLFSCLSAKWENNDAIDKAVTQSLGDKKVRVRGCARVGAGE